MPRFWKVLLLFVVALFVGFTQTAQAGRRVALVIGNAHFASLNDLNNPINDANLIARTLRTDGFEIVGGGAITDATRSRFINAVDDFALAADNAEIALFYYSGHGSASGNVNFLSTSDDGTVTATDILRRLTFSRSNLRVILLDACRSERRNAGGFVQMDAPENTLIGFATQPGDTASDGPAGTNSPYAAALAEALRVPGADLFTMFNEVGLKVMRRTMGGKVQKPWINASPISGTYYLSQPVYASTAPSAPVATSIDVIPQQMQTPTPAPVPHVHVSSGQADSYIQQAWLQLSRSDYEGARATLAQGISLDPDSSQAHSYMGYAWFEHGNALRHQIMLITDVAERNRRLSDLIKSHYAPAFKELDSAINLNKGYSSYFRHRGNAVIGVYHTRRVLGWSTAGTMDRAIRDLETATKTDPTSMLSANDLGIAYFLAGRFDDAEQSFRAALSINPKYKDPHDGLCRVYMRLGRVADAQAEANIAAQASEFEKKQCLRTQLAGAQ